VAILDFLFASKKDRGSLPLFDEKEAEALLGKHGFRILKKKPRMTIATQLDDKEHFGYLEADYIVERNKRRYLVVVSKDDAADPVFRGKLLEASYVFSQKNILLLDMESKSTHTVAFKFHRETSFDDVFRALIIVFIVLGIIGIIWLLLAAKLV